MSVFKKLLGQTALYGLSSIIARAINFLLTPFLAYHLSVAQFGVSIDIYSIAAFLNIIYLFGLETSYFRFAKQSQFSEQFVFNQIQTIILVLSLVLSVIMVASAVHITHFLEYTGKEHYIYILAAILVFDSLAAIPFARLRLENKALRFASIKIINISLNMGLVFFFLLVCKSQYYAGSSNVFSQFCAALYIPKDDVFYVFLANLLANATLLFFFFPTWKHFVFKFDFTFVKSILKYAYPLVILGLAGMMNEMLSRMIFKKVLPPNFYPAYSSQEALGIFGASYKIAMLMGLAIQSFRYAAEPFFFNQAKEKNSPYTFAQVTLWFVVSCMLLFIILSTNLTIIGSIMLPKSDYQNGLLIVPLLLISSMLLGVCFNLNIAFKLKDKNIYNTYISMVGLLVTVFGNLLLIPIAGYFGSAITTLLCYLTMAILNYFFAQKLMPVPYQLSRMVLYTIVPIFLFLFQKLIHIETWYWDLVYSIFSILFYLIMVLSIEKKFNFIIEKFRK